MMHKPGLCSALVLAGSLAAQLSAQTRDETERLLAELTNAHGEF